MSGHPGVQSRALSPAHAHASPWVVTVPRSTLEAGDSRELMNRLAPCVITINNKQQ